MSDRTVTRSMTEIYLVRHGETDWNRAGRLQGTIDTPLNHVGLEQARRVASWFGTRLISHVVTSPLARARDTALSIARCGGCRLTIEPSLIEIDHGSWTGLTVSRIAREFPDAAIDGRLRPEACEIGGGEALAAAYWRASGVLRKLLAGPSARAVVVVSHGVVNALVICAAVGIAPAQMDQFTQPNGFAHLLRFRRRTLVDVANPVVGPIVAPLADGGERPASPWSPSR